MLGTALAAGVCLARDNMHQRLLASGPSHAELALNRLPIKLLPLDLSKENIKAIAGVQHVRSASMHCTALVRHPMAPSMDEEHVRKINLLEVLTEKFPSVLSPPEDALHLLSIDDIQAYFKRGGDQFSQPGGANPQAPNVAAHLNTPLEVKHNQLAATVAGYRQAAIADGIPFRYSGCLQPRLALHISMGSLELLGKSLCSMQHTDV